MKLHQKPAIPRDLNKKIDGFIKDNLGDEIMVRVCGIAAKKVRREKLRKK